LQETKDLRHADDLEAALAREQIIPTMTEDEARQLQGTPITRTCGVHITSTVRTIRSLVIAHGNASFVSVAEQNPNYGRHCLRIWRIPRQP